MNDNQIIAMTDVYLVSYMRAMEKTKNPNIAVQAAMAVCSVVANQPKNEPETIPWAAMLMEALKNIKKDCEESGSDPDGEE